MGELLARLADRRRIDERDVGGRVRHQDRVIERLVACLQIREHEVFLQIVVKRGDLGVSARHLQLQRGHGGRQQAFETAGAALRLGERRPLVEARIAQQLIPAGVFRRLCRHLAGSVLWGTDIKCANPTRSTLAPHAGRKVPRETAPEGQLVVLMQIRSSGATMFNVRLLKTHLKH
jgi:hypothetical protein